MGVARPYACPICCELFTKWGLCQSHLGGSVLCSRALESESSGGSGSAGSTGVLEEPELQEHCREAANRGILHEQAEFTSVTERLNRARKASLLTEIEQADLLQLCPELAELQVLVQKAVLDRFLIPGRGDFKWIDDKLGWFRRCLEFSRRTVPVAVPVRSSSSAASLVCALASHGLLPEVLSQDYCDRYLRMAPDIQSQVVGALQASVPTSERGHFSKYFEHLCLNEEYIYKLMNTPPHHIALKPRQIQFKDLEWGLYHNLLHKTLLLKRASDDQIFSYLAEDVRKGTAVREDSLCFVHAATDRERQKTDVLSSLLHAAVVNAHVRVCARLIAEGFEVNELAGSQRSTPLHLAAASAASRGDLRVVKLLLEKGADVHLQDGSGHTALYCAIQADVGDSVGSSWSASSTSSTPQSRFLDRKMQFDVCNVLLHAGSSLEPQRSGETLAVEKGLLDLRNLICFHRKLRPLIERFNLNPAAIGELEKLQYETQVYILDLFDEHIAVGGEAAALELCALARSDFIQKKNEVQVLANRLARKLRFSRKAVEALVDLPPGAGLVALSTFHLEESAPKIFSVQGSAGAAEAQSSSSSAEAAVQQQKNMRVLEEVTGIDFELSESFIRHLESRTVQDAVEADARKWQPWLRCMGVQDNCGQHGPRDRAVWHQEIKLRIDLLICKASTPLVKEDFSDRVLQTFLYKFAANGTVARVTEVLTMIEAAAAGMVRNDVLDWTAYLANFLRNLDPVLYNKLAAADSSGEQEEGVQELEQDTSQPLAAANVVAAAMAAAAVDVHGR